MFDPAVFLVLLEQRSLSLKDHTRLFVETANYTLYLDYCSCPEMVLEGILPAFVEWVLVSCGSPLIVDIADDTSPTPDPEPSPQSPRCAEPKPKPTADGEPEPAATDEPLPWRATELRIASELKPDQSDQVREPATELATVENAMNGESTEGSSTHCIMAEGDQLSMDNNEDLINLDIDANMPVLLPPSSELSSYPELYTCLDFPPTLPLLPPPIIPTASSASLLCPGSPSAQTSAHHLCTGFAAGLPLSIGVMAVGSLVSASSL